MPTTEHPNRVLPVSNKCPKCQKVRQIMVDPDDYQRFIQRRGHIQEIFPYLTSSERELLITGYCDPCWAVIFPPEDEDKT